jgi:hypothetical protein
VPGYFQKSHIEERNRFVAKFAGFSDGTKTSTVLEALKVHDAKNAYYSTDNKEIHVEFPTEQLMIRACIYTIHIGDMYIKGIPREGAWNNRDKFLANHKPRRQSLENYQIPIANPMKWNLFNKHIESSQTSANKLISPAPQGTQRSIPKSRIDLAKQNQTHHNSKEKITLRNNTSDRTAKQPNDYRVGKSTRHVPRPSNVATGSNTIPVTSNRLEMKGKTQTQDEHNDCKNTQKSRFQSPSPADSVVESVEAQGERLC